MKQTWLIAAGLLMVMVGFQNCAETKFSTVSGGDAVEKGSLVDMDAGDDGGDDGDDAEGSISQTTPIQPPSDDNRPPKKNPPTTTTEQQPPVTVTEEEVGEEEVAPSPQDAVLKPCFLQGNGRRDLKLGYIEDALSNSNHAASRAVCISENACLNIVSQLYAVSEWGPKELFCKGNPNAKPLTDAEVQGLVDKALAP